MSADPFENADVDPAEEKPVEAYDLTRAQLGRDARPETLALIEERTATLFATELERLLRVRTRVEVLESSSMRWTEYAETCMAGGCYNYLDLDALGGFGQLEIDLQCVFSFLDRLFGGTGESIEDTAPRVKFSRVEERVIRRLVHLFARSFEDAWRPVVPMTVRHVRVETKTSSAAPATNGDWVLITKLDIIADDKSMGTMRVVLPVALLEPHKERLASGSYEDQRRDEGDWEEAFRLLVPAVPVFVVAELGRNTLTVGDIMNWQEGDVIRLDQASERPIKISVNGIAKYLGDITVQYGNLAVQLRSMTGRRRQGAQEESDD